MTAPDLHTALQREREAWRYLADATPDGTNEEIEEAYEHVTAAQRATDQALAAREARPTLAEVEAALAELRVPFAPGRHDGRAIAHNGALLAARTALRALYARGGVE